MRNVIFKSVFLALIAGSAVAGDVPVANPPTVKVENVTGNPAKPGEFYIVRVRLPAEGLFKPHFHNVKRYISVISGTLYSCNGGVASSKTVVAHPPGDFFEQPPKMVHCSWAKEGPVDYLEFGVGPVDVIYVDKDSVPLQP